MAAVEPVPILAERVRGCGFRKPGGYYMIEGGFSEHGCCLMPFEVGSCPTCGSGIKPARGFTWTDHALLPSEPACEGGALKESYPHWAACQARWIASGFEPNSDRPMGRIGLIWIGAEHYPSVADFVLEAKRMGISRRIAQVPRDFEAGKTWIFLGHRAAVGRVPDQRPGIFMLWKPDRVEYVLREAEVTEEFVERLRKRGITPVVVEPLESGREPWPPPLRYRPVGP